MRRAEQLQRRRETVAAMKEAIEAAEADAAIGFHITWIRADGEFGDAYDSPDLLQMTEAVKLSALTARILGESKA